MACVCGHSEEEHGNDPDFPGSTACQTCMGLVGFGGEENYAGWECIAFEEDENDEDDKRRTEEAIGRFDFSDE